MIVFSRSLCFYQLFDEFNKFNWLKLRNELFNFRTVLLPQLYNIIQECTGCGGKNTKSCNAIDISAIANEIIFI